MKYLKSYKIFESRFIEFRELISTINDICQDFEDNNCSCSIFPQDDIKLNIVSLKSRGHLSSISQPFYLEIDIDRRIIVPNEKRSGFGPFPEWFIDNCRRIEDFMKAEGFETKPSVRYGVDWENFDTVDELSEYSTFLPIYKIRLEFFKSEKIEESYRERVMSVKYGDEVLDECDEVIQTIKEMLLDLEDVGIQSYVHYSPMTCMGREESPKIVVDINADERLFASKIQDIHDVTDRIKSYVKSLRFVTAEGTWTTNRNITRQILIQR